MNSYACLKKEWVVGTWFYAEQSSACSLYPRRADGNPFLCSIGLFICRRWRELFFFAVIPFSRCGGAPRVASEWTLAGLLFCRLGQQGWGDSDRLTAVCCVSRSNCPLVTIVDLASPSVVLTSWMSWVNSKVGGSGSVHACLGMSVYVSVTPTLGTEYVTWSHPW